MDLFIVFFVLSILFALPVIIRFISWIKNKILKIKPRKENTLGRRDTLIIGLVLLFISLLLARCGVSMSSSDIAVSDSTQNEQVIEQSQNEQNVERHQIKPRDIAGILDAALDTMLSFSGEGPTDFIIEGEEIIRSKSDSSLLAWIFVIHTVMLCFLAPIAGGALLFEILANLFPSLVAWIKTLSPNKEKYYFSELNEKSLTLAQSISDKFADSKSKPVMIVMSYDDDDKNDDNSLILSAQKIGLLCVKSDLLHFRISKSGKKKLILINEDEGNNVQMLATLCEKLDLQQLKDSEFYVFTSEPAYDYAIGKIRDKIKHRIECAAGTKQDAKSELPIVLNVNCYNNLIKNLLDTIPLFEPVAEEYKKLKRLESIDINLTIIGLGKIGMQMLTASYWCGQILDTRLNITAISRESEAEFLRKIDYVNPEIMQSSEENNEILSIFNKTDKVNDEPVIAPPYAKIKYLCRNIKSDEFLRYLRNDKDIEKPNYYFISTGSDIENIEMANRLCELLSNRYCMKKSPPKTVITYVVYDSELASVLNSKIEGSAKTGSPDSYIYMRAVGSLEEVYSYENVFMERFIKSADNVNSNYSKAKAVDSDKLQQLFTNDYGFSSSMARVIHRKYKVFSAKMWEASLFDAKSENEYAELCEKSLQSYKAAIQGTPRTDVLACDLAWLEHRRWVAFIRTQGFRGHDNPEVFFNHFKSQKSIPLKRHLCLVEARRGYTYSNDKTFIPDRLDEIYHITKFSSHFKNNDYPDNEFKEEKKDDDCVLKEKRCGILVFLRSIFHKKG